MSDMTVRGRREEERTVQLGSAQKAEGRDGYQGDFAPEQISKESGRQRRVFDGERGSV